LRVRRFIIRPMFTCGWCGTHYQIWKSQCANCGGPMPPPPGMDMGPAPPPPPRQLPKGFALKVGFTRNLATIFGLVISLFAGLITFALVSQGSWGAVFPGFFLLGGLALLRMGILNALHTLQAFRKGIAIKGRIASVTQDTQTKVNNRHPWNIVYTFESEGHSHDGKAITFDAETAVRLYGRPPAWVLVVEGKPDRNTLYPPVR
jgi:hypothetical protein